MSKVAENLLKIKEELAPYNPKIVAVTKYYDETAIIDAYEAGIRDFGENRVQDALTKIDKLPIEIRRNAHFHLIGHLQTNKVKKAVGNFELIHSVDSVKLAKAIDAEACIQGIQQRVLLQVNNANEESKFGFSTNEVIENFQEIISLPHLKVEGLMTIAPLTEDENRLEMLFREIIQIKDIVLKRYNYNLIEISMGMSNDYKIAAREGATIVRVGKKLFLK